MIPNALRIDHGNGTVDADAEAVGLGAINQGGWAGQIEFLEPLLQKVPRLQTLPLGTTLRVRLVRAQEDMAGIAGQTQGLSLLGEF
jgi:hypothetical protein